MSFTELDLSFLPAVNATLNGAAAVLLAVGLVLIKQQKRTAHRNVMISAFVLSGLFLVTYLVHYAWRAAQAGEIHTKFVADPPWQTLYYVMLISHILLAMTVPIFAVLLIYLGLTGKDQAHKKVARWGWPVWMYVSITGVFIYFALYHWNQGINA